MARAGFGSCPLGCSGPRKARPKDDSLLASRLVAMQPLRDAWKFTRDRLDQSYQDLTEKQLIWRPHPDAHSIGEILYHVAAAEHYWAARLTDQNPAKDAW